MIRGAAPGLCAAPRPPIVLSCVACLRQVSLYLLLLEERYGQPLDMGVLWYLNDQASCLAMPMSPSALLQEVGCCCQNV